MLRPHRRKPITPSSTQPTCRWTWPRPFASSAILNAAAIVPNRGRKLSDFRPGLPLQDFFQVYVSTEEERSMTVVGHVQQMHLSHCFQGSKTFSCSTCHNPHGEPAAAERTAYYNSICQSCHKPELCRVDPQRRSKESPDNNCVQCHMPRSKTDIPHLAFTPHRVGIHDAPTTEPRVESRPAKLKPFLDFSRVSDIDRKLSLGEGYRQAALFGTDPKRAPDYRQQALVLLSAVYDAGLRDPDLEAGLTQLYFDANMGHPRALADAALAYPEIAGESRCNALCDRAQLEGLDKNYAVALPDLKELIGLRRLASDWLLLARYTNAQGNEAAAVESRWRRPCVSTSPPVGGAAVLGGLLSRTRRRQAGRVAPKACRTLSRADTLPRSGCSDGLPSASFP